jgi:16S rRNA (guanine527-N7)-methyltransferase
VFAELLREKLREVAQLSPDQIEKLEQHYLLIIKWNRIFNLTSIHEEAEVVERHYCESIFLGTNLPAGNLRIADIGSGAGFPGFPVAVLRPECSVFLIESNQRKSVFLREATRAMRNIWVIAKRVEDVTEEFDWATCRAVKFSEVGGSGARISHFFALLSGVERPPSCFTWNTPIQLPWGRQRYLWLGTRRST